MEHVSGLHIGFFYTKYNDVLVEIGEENEGVAKLPSEYAKTVSGNVLALVSGSGDVLDVDDIPCDKVFEVSGGSFVSFVRNGNVCAFLVDPSTLEMRSEVTSGRLGELSAIEVESDAFTLRVLTVSNHVDASEVESGEKYLLVVTTGGVTENKNDKTVVVSSAAAKLFDIEV